jgi:hypothetical protein
MDCGEAVPLQYDFHINPCLLVTSSMYSHLRRFSEYQLVYTSQGSLADSKELGQRVGPDSRALKYKGSPSKTEAVI